jgi:hypothetical protein
MYSHRQARAVWGNKKTKKIVLVSTVPSILSLDRSGSAAASDVENGVDVDKNDTVPEREKEKLKGKKGRRGFLLSCRH